MPSHNSTASRHHHHHHHSHVGCHQNGAHSHHHPCSEDHLWKIELDPSTLAHLELDDCRISRHTNVLKGYLTFECQNSQSLNPPGKKECGIRFSELWIQLEGMARTHFWTRQENCAHLVHNSEEHNFLLDPTNSDEVITTTDRGHQVDLTKNILTAYIFRFIHHGKLIQSTNLSLGLYSMPFEINLNGPASLPPSHSFEDGGIEYRLVVYGTDSATEGCSTNQNFCRLTEKFIILLGGRLNIATKNVDSFMTSSSTSLIQNLPFPLVKINSREKLPLSRQNSRDTLPSLSKRNSRDFVFPLLRRNSREPCLDFKFEVNDDQKMGILIGEILQCKLHIENPENEVVGDICIDFVQKFTYFANNRSKTVTTVLGQRAFLSSEHDVGGENGGIFCQAQFRVPGNLMPSFDVQKKGAKKCIEIFYFIQFSAEVVGKWPLRGEQMVVIGTTRKIETKMETDHHLELMHMPSIDDEEIDKCQLTPEPQKLLGVEASQEILTRSKEKIATFRNLDEWRYDDQSKTLDSKVSGLDELEIFLMPFGRSLHFLV